MPTNLEQLKDRLYEYSDLCNTPGSQQLKDIYSTYYGTEDPAYNNERRGGLVSRFWLAAANGGEALDGINGRKERHAAKEPSDWNKYPGRL